jgi:hypothetical protein
VDDLERSIAFWRNIAQLDVKQSENHVNVAGYIALLPAARRASSESTQIDFPDDGALSEAKQRILVFVEAADLNAIDQRLHGAALPTIGLT